MKATGRETMTVHQFNRARRWDRRVRPAYSAGVMDGFDACLAGHACPDPLLSEYNTKFYVRPRMRWIQGVSNATIARSRGRYDGWQLAQKEVVTAQEEDWIETQVADFSAELDRWPTAKKAA